jgi:hypothetical protein
MHDGWREYKNSHAKLPNAVEGLKHENTHGSHLGNE